MPKLAVADDKCKCKTINLAKEGYTIEERRCKMLIYEKRIPREPPTVCAPLLELGLKEAPKQAKKFRACTAEDMKTTCPPVMCTCPPMPKPLTFMDMVKKGLVFGLKSAILAGVVWWTWNVGIWADAKTSECVYVDLKNQIVGEDVSCEEFRSRRPRIERWLQFGRQHWNQAVSCAFECTNKFIEGFSKEECPSEEESTKKA